MRIRDVFGAGDSQYIVDDTIPETPDNIASDLIHSFFQSEPDGIA